MCPHGGQASPVVPNPRVQLSGAPSVQLSADWIIAGCPGVPSSVPPCVTAQWVTGTVRVQSGGQPLVVQSGSALTQPNGVPLTVITTQTRVNAT